jgi:hypothetical protein
MSAPEKMLLHRVGPLFQQGTDGLAVTVLDGHRDQIRGPLRLVSPSWPAGISSDAVRRRSRRPEDGPEEIADQVRVDVLGSPAHLFLLEPRDPFADGGFDFSLRVHVALARLPRPDHVAVEEDLPRATEPGVDGARTSKTNIPKSRRYFTCFFRLAQCTIKVANRAGADRQSVLTNSSACRRTTR